MSNSCAKLATPITLIGLLYAMPEAADSFFFSTGNPDGKITTATRPATAGKFEIESADDFVLTGATSISSATFTGLLTGDTDVGEVRVEIHRVFPKDSDIGRTSGPRMFATSQVPTRVNSPSDAEFADRDTASANLTFSTTDLGAFTAANSVQAGGIHPKPGQTTGGDGAITGEEVQFDVSFTDPIILPADHYFFVPQVEVTDPSGDYYLAVGAETNRRPWYAIPAQNLLIARAPRPWPEIQARMVNLSKIDGASIARHAARRRNRLKIKIQTPLRSRQRKACGSCWPTPAFATRPSDEPSSPSLASWQKQAT